MGESQLPTTTPGRALTTAVRVELLLLLRCPTARGRAIHD